MPQPSVSSARAADHGFVARKAAYAGFEMTSFFLPPVYVATVLLRRGMKEFSANRFLRTTWLGSLGGGAASGTAAYLWGMRATDETLKDVRRDLTYDIKSARRDDYATIGLVIGAVLAPGLLLNRAHLYNLILGGASLGSGMSILTFHYHSLTAPHNQQRNETHSAKNS